MKNACRQHKHAQPHKYFSVVIWMPGPFPDSDVAPSIPILFVLPEIEFLHVGHRLEDETQGKDDDADDVNDVEFRVQRQNWRVDENHAQTHREHPQRLKCPKSCKSETVFPLPVKSSVLPDDDNSVKKIARETKTPNAN